MSGISDQFTTIGIEAVAWGTAAATLTRGIEAKPGNKPTHRVEHRPSAGFRPGYIGDPSDTHVVDARGGTYTLVLNDLVVTASGPVATFRYAVIYDDTVAGDPLVGWWDYGSSITMANAETFTVDFTGAALTLS